MKLFIALILVASALSSRIHLPSYPLFWAGQTLTWNVWARIDSDVFNLFGCPNDCIEPASVVDIEFTAAHTKVTVQAGPAEILLDFFSPVSLTDYVRQSIPYSYLTVTVTDAPKHAHIDILSAIDDSWTAQNETELEVINGRDSLILALAGVNPISRTEWQDMATYGKVVFAIDKGDSRHVTSFQSGHPSDIATRFRSEGRLEARDSYQTGQWVALSAELHRGRGGQSVSFAIGLERDDVVLWLDELQTGYYQSELSGTQETVDYFFKDEPAARKESEELDARVKAIGNTISENYTDILESSIRQIWGGFEVTIPKHSKDTTKARAFIKEISTDGNAQTVADLIPKTLPVFYLLAPEYIRLMCEPIMEYTLQWPATFAFHDLGKHYPNVTGETVEDQEKLIMDQTSVIHWMAYSYQKASGNTDWITPYLRPMQAYADHLVRNAIYPPSERSSVDAIAASPNQTVLALYAVVGMNAFGALSGMSNYSDTARAYAERILDLGFDSSRTHLRAHYDDPDDSWITAYPLGFDRVLGLGTFNESTQKLLSDFYESKMHRFGLALDDRVDYTVAELAMWTTTTTSTAVRDAVIDGIHGVLEREENDSPGPTQWNVTGENAGLWFFSVAKPIVGSYFMPAIVALEDQERDGVY